MANIDLEPLEDKRSSIRLPKFESVIRNSRIQITIFRITKIRKLFCPKDANKSNSGLIQDHGFPWDRTNEDAKPEYFHVFESVSRSFHTYKDIESIVVVC